MREEENVRKLKTVSCLLIAGIIGAVSSVQATPITYVKVTNDADSGIDSDTADPGRA